MTIPGYHAVDLSRELLLGHLIRIVAYTPLIVLHLLVPFPLWATEIEWKSHRLLPPSPQRSSSLLSSPLLSSSPLPSFLISISSPLFLLLPCYVHLPVPFCIGRIHPRMCETPAGRRIATWNTPTPPHWLSSSSLCWGPTERKREREWRIEKEMEKWIERERRCEKKER